MIVNAIIVVLSFALVLGILVYIHEMGHYGVAKLFGTKIERFSIGFGKPIAGWVNKAGEEWTVGRIPLGGYVKFAGDENASSVSTRDRTSLRAEYGEAADQLFQFKPLWQRTLIVAAGPFANFVLAVLLFAVLAWSFGETRFQPRIESVASDSAASEAGFLAGDLIRSINGRAIEDAADVQAYVALRAEETLDVIVERAGREVALKVTPRRVLREDAIGGDAEMGTLGVVLGGGSDAITRQDYSLMQAIPYGFARVGEVTSMTGTYVKRIFTGQEDGKAMGGVLRIAAVTGKVAVDTSRAEQVPFAQRAKALTFSMLSLMALLSVGLGLANLLPIPALDGGHLLYYGYEAIAGRPLSVEAQAMGYRLGALVLVLAFVYLTVNDVGYIRSLLF